MVKKYSISGEKGITRKLSFNIFNQNFLSFTIYVYCLQIIFPHPNPVFTFLKRQVSTWEDLYLIHGYVIQDTYLHGTEGGRPEQIPCYTRDKNSVLVAGLPHHVPATHI
jgi:hypothetical protein